MRADVNQQPRTNITTLAAVGGNCPLAPHMRPFVPYRCAGLIEDNLPIKRMHFLLGLGGYTPQDAMIMPLPPQQQQRQWRRQGGGNSDGRSHDGDSNGDGNDDGRWQRQRK